MESVDRRSSKSCIRILLLLWLSAERIHAKKTRVTWVNGIAHNLEHMVEGQVVISKLFGGKPVKFCHNPTAMAHDDDMRGYLSDLSQAGSQKLGRITAEVDSLVNHLREAVSVVGRRGCVIHIAHSQGALVTHLASKQLTQTEMTQIEILSFGGAAALRTSESTPFRRCINYYSVNDPLLMVVPSASQALRSGLVAGDNEFCFLAPRGGDPILDHNLLGPTYAQALKWEGERFQRLYVSVLYKVVNFLTMITLAGAKALNEKLRSTLRWFLRPIVAFCLLLYRLVVRALLNGRDFLEDKLWKPTTLLVVLVCDWVRISIRGWRGEDKYELVP